MAKTLVGFDERTAFALARMVRDEVHRQTSARTNIVANDTYVREMDTAIAKEEITAFANDTPGQGRAESINRPSNSSQFNTYNYATVLNIYSQSVAVDTRIIVGRLWDGNWYLISADCA